MKVRYTFHVLERIKHIGIDKRLVIECLENPDKTQLKEGTIDV